MDIQTLSLICGSIALLFSIDEEDKKGDDTLSKKDKKTVTKKPGKKPAREVRPRTNRKGTVMSKHSQRKAAQQKAEQKADEDNHSTEVDPDTVIGDESQTLSGTGDVSEGDTGTGEESGEASGDETAGETGDESGGENITETVNENVTDNPL